MRVGQPEIREIAKLLGHHGAPEQEFYALTQLLVGEVGNERVGDAMRELTWTDAQTCWVRLRPEVADGRSPTVARAECRWCWPTGA